MSYIKELFKLDLSSIVISIFIILSAIIACYEIVCKFSDIIGKPIGAMKQKKKDHELLVQTIKDLRDLHDKHEEDTKQSIIHDQMIKKDLANVSFAIAQIKDEVTLMRTQRDNDKLAEYKDKIGQSYRYYKERKFSEDEKIPYWNHMEKEALEGLIKQYENHGGTNSFVHSIVEPEIQTWKLIE